MDLEEVKILLKALFMIGKRVIRVTSVLLCMLVILVGCSKRDDFDYHIKMGTEVGENEYRRITEFMKYFTQTPILESFDSDNTVAVLKFSLYKLQYESPELFEYDEAIGKYRGSFDVVSEYITNLFDIEEISHFSDREVTYYKDKVIFDKSWHSFGGNPVIEKAVDHNNQIYVTGYIDQPYIDKTKNNVDSIDPGTHDMFFRAVLTVIDDTKYRLKSFEIS